MVPFAASSLAQVSCVLWACPIMEIRRVALQAPGSVSTHLVLVNGLHFLKTPELPMRVSLGDLWKSRSEGREHAVLSLCTPASWPARPLWGLWVSLEQGPPCLGSMPTAACLWAHEQHGATPLTGAKTILFCLLRALGRALAGVDRSCLPTDHFQGWQDLGDFRK